MKQILILISSCLQSKPKQTPILAGSDSWAQGSWPQCSFLPSLLGPVLRKGDAPASSPWGDKLRHLCWAHHLPKPSDVAGWSRWPLQPSSCWCPHHNAPWVSTSHSTSESSLESAGLSGEVQEMTDSLCESRLEFPRLCPSILLPHDPCCCYSEPQRGPCTSHLWVLRVF